MKKNGFTLVEILGAIIILGLLFILAFPSIVDQITGITKDIDQATVQLIRNSTKVHMDKNENLFPIHSGNVYCISLQTLVSSGVLVEDLTDVKSNKKIDLTQVVKVEIENEANIDYLIVNANQCQEIRN